MSSPTDLAHPLIIAQYHIEDHQRRDEHWSLVALNPGPTDSIAHIYELSGNHSTFRYTSYTIPHFLRSNEQLRGGCLVGSVSADRLGWLEHRLRDVPIVYNDLNFDCQTWVLDALRLIAGNDSEEEGVDIFLVSEQRIRKELELEREKWDTGEDTFEERLYLPLKK